MEGLLRILDLGFVFVVPTIVWTILIAGVFQLIRESMPKPKVTPRQVARQGRSQ
jgi:hypothetical protein